MQTLVECPEIAGLSVLLLTLEVGDPDVVFELKKHTEGAPREKYALSALRLGVLAFAKRWANWIRRLFRMPRRICY